MKVETINKANEIIEIKKKLENEIIKIDDALDSEGGPRPITRMGISDGRNVSKFLIEDREFITQVCVLWKQKIQTRLTEINLELMAL